MVKFPKNECAEVKAEHRKIYQPSKGVVEVHFDCNFFSVNRERNVLVILVDL